MSKFIEMNDNGDTITTLEDINKCDYMYNEICCNEKSRFVADFVEKEDCSNCRLFKKETMRSKKPKIDNLYKLDNSPL